MQEIPIETRKQWREWLRKNHKKESNVAVVLHKKHTGKNTVSHRDLMEEAICWGWIDTTVKRLDEDRFLRRFAKRNKNSRWSRATLSYAENMIKEKKMTKQGLKMYEEGKKKKVIDHDLPKNPETPEILKKALKKEKLDKFFEALAPSWKRMYIYMILRSVKDETKEKWVKETIKQTKIKLNSRRSAP